MESVLLRPNRKGTYLSLAFGLVCAAVGATMIGTGNNVGIVVLLLAAVGLYGGVGGLIPGLGLRISEHGFYLKSFGKSWGAQWLETEGFTPKRIPVGRREDVDVVEIRYQEGIGNAHLPRRRLGKTLGVDERFLIAAYGGLSNTQLADLLERYRTSS